MSTNVGLHENGGQFGVDAGGKEKAGHLTYLGFQGFRLLRNRDGVQVNNAKDIIKFSL